MEAPASAADTSSEAVSVKSPFLQTLVERGFYHQCTNVAGLDDKLRTGEVVKAYLGFDATADRSVCVHVFCCVRHESNGEKMKDMIRLMAIGVHFC